MDPLTIALTFGPQFVAAITKIFEANKAAEAQTGAANAAIAAQLSMFGVGRAALEPFISGGAASMGLLTGSPAVAAQAAKQQLPWLLTKGGETKKLGFQATPADVKKLTDQGWKVTQTGQAHADAVAGQAAVPGQLDRFMKPIQITQDQLENYPGYKWALGQGLKGATAALKPRGLTSSSGAAIKGSEAYAQGLASQTFQQMFANRLANRQMAWNALYGTAAIGESAGTGVSTAAATAGKDIGTNLTNIGTAQAGADVATANAVTGFANALWQQQMAQNQRASAGLPPISNPTITETGVQGQ